MYVREPMIGDFFDATVQSGGWQDANAVRLASNYVATDLVKLYRDFGKTETQNEQDSLIDPDTFVQLIDMILQKKISSRGAKDTLAIMFKKGGSPADIAEKEGLEQKSDENALLPIVQQVIDRNPAVAADFRGGKQSALQFLVGQGMKLTKGSADPQVLNELLRKVLG